MPAQALTVRHPWPGRPIEPFDIAHPALPAALDGFRVLHFSDLHVRSGAPRGDWFTRLGDALERTPVDLVTITGDIMDHPGDERAAARVLAGLSERWDARHGAIGVFGNHDTAPFRRIARREVAGVTWLDRAIRTIDEPGADGEPDARLHVLGTDFPEDLIGATLRLGETRREEAERVAGTGAGAPDEFTLTLVHVPTMIVPAADLALPLLLSGHTHGGQIRLSSSNAPHTSSDMRSHLASGVLRLRRTLCCISRGMGESVAQDLRVNCPRQLPLYTLRRGPFAAIEPSADIEAVHAIVRW